MSESEISVIASTASDEISVIASPAWDGTCGANNCPKPVTDKGDPKGATHTLPGTHILTGMPVCPHIVGTGFAKGIGMTCSRLSKGAQNM
jgi:hypothetical protein